MIHSRQHLLASNFLASALAGGLRLRTDIGAGVSDADLEAPQTWSTIGAKQTLVYSY